jgi:hypothetical protein
MYQLLFLYSVKYLSYKNLQIEIMNLLETQPLCTMPGSEQLRQIYLCITQGTTEDQGQNKIC